MDEESIFVNRVKMERSRGSKIRRRIDFQLHDDSNINHGEIIEILDEESIFVNRVEWNREDRTFFGEKSIFV